MVNLLKSQNMIKIDDLSDGISFLREWRNLTNSILESGYEIIDEISFFLEIENSIIMFNIINTSVDGNQFDSIIELINYLGYE